MKYVIRNMEAETLYLVISTFMGESVRYISNDYQKSLAKAGEVVILENKEIDELNEFSPSSNYPHLEKQTEIDPEVTYGERMTDCWYSDNRQVKIVEFKTDKIYTPEVVSNPEE